MITRQPKWSDKPLYYRTDYTTYRKLKAIKRWYWQTVYDRARWRHWARKTVYKSDKVPTYCDIFPAVSLVFDAWYYDARMPSATEWPPFTSATVASINDIYERAKAWFMEKRGEADPLADITELK